MTKELKDQIVQKIRDWWTVNGGNGPAVIGISGGKDSSVVAALCVEALGKEKVLGVMMPNGEQKDISDSKHLCRHLKIRNIGTNIQPMVIEFLESIHILNKELLKENHFKPRADSSRYTTNIPPRIRMTMLYAIAQDLDGRVIGTGNASENFVGWNTYAGDSISDFNPIKNLFVDEVVELGKILKLPKSLVEKAPSDGLTGKTDEENLGFTYADVKKVALKIPDWQMKDANDNSLIPFADIEAKHKATQFKRDIINVPGIEFYRDKNGRIVCAK